MEEPVKSWGIAICARIILEDGAYMHRANRNISTPTWSILNLKIFLDLTMVVVTAVAIIALSSSSLLSFSSSVVEPNSSKENCMRGEDQERRGGLGEGKGGS